MDTPVSLTGELTMLELTAALKPLLRQAEQAPSMLIDLSQSGACDSATLSLLFELSRRSASHNGRLRVRGVPDTLISLARLYDAEALLQGMMERPA